MRQKIVAGNWKMNKTYSEALNLATEVGNYIEQNPLADHQQVVLCVPAIYVVDAEQETSSIDNLWVGAQNCHYKDSGAFTGEISAQMLQSVGVKYVIIGHSERREYFNETNNLLKQKVDSALANGLKVIFCCGESLKTREKNDYKEWIEEQLTESLFHLSMPQLLNVAIAYEPIWAIGTGKTASPEQAQEVHEHIRYLMMNIYGAATANKVPILYGGSCNAANAATLFAQPDIDGGLIGGASLKIDDFAAIIKAMP